MAIRKETNPKDSTCKNCGGYIPEPNVAYGIDPLALCGCSNPKDLVNLEDFKERFQDTAISDYRSISDIKKAVGEMKPDTYLLGCRKHWSDDYGATCTCDENATTAKIFYERAKKDFLTALGIEEDSE